MSFLICFLSHDRLSPFATPSQKTAFARPRPRGRFLLREEKETGAVSPFAPSSQEDVFASRRRNRRGISFCTFLTRRCFCDRKKRQAQCLLLHLPHKKTFLRAEEERGVAPFAPSADAARPASGALSTPGRPRGFCEKKKKFARKNIRKTFVFFSKSFIIVLSVLY